jgi:hypothetical protein
MSTAPAYAATAQTAQVQIATANTARDGTGTIGTLITGAANGTRVDDITITAAGTTTAGVIRMFIHDGTNYRLLNEFLVSAVTPSPTVAVWSTALYNMGIILKSGWSLRFSTHNAETFNVIATRAGDF